MTQSPFLPYANSTLRFAVPTGQLTQDPRGNPTVIEQAVTVTAVLKYGSTRSAARAEAQRPVGVPTFAVYLEGYIAAPLSTAQQKSTFERYVLPSCRCAATVNGKTGQFYLDPFVKNPYLQSVQVHFADPIAGWFVEGARVTVPTFEAV